MKITCQQRFSKLNGPSTRPILGFVMKSSKTQQSHTLCGEVCSCRALSGLLRNCKCRILCTELEKPGQGNNAKMPRKIYDFDTRNLLG